MTKKKRIKRKLLLDEMVVRKDNLPQTNSYHDVKHIVHDYHKAGLSDIEIVDLCESDGRIVVTKNVKDFRPLARERKVGVIGISDNILPGDLDNLLFSKLRNWLPNFRNRFYVSIRVPKRKKPKN